MSDLVGNPEDRFSRVAAQFTILYLFSDSRFPDVWRRVRETQSNSQPTGSSESRGDQSPSSGTTGQRS